MGGGRYSWARYYHTDLQRFIQEDGLLDMARPNPYAYARNAPTRYVDPSGNLAVGAIIGASIGFYSGFTGASVQQESPAAWRVGASVPLTQRKSAARSCSAASSVE
jgi:hypothetical protein